jgi:hypothetical protein
MKKLKFSMAAVFIMGALMMTTARAATILIDFGGNTSAQTTHGASPNDPNNYWNNYVGSNLSGLIDTTDLSTKVNLSVGILGSQSNASGTTASSLFPINATRDSIYVNKGETGTLTLTGLDSTGLTAYTFTFYASRTGVYDNRTTDYTVTGNGQVLITSLDAANNINNTAVVSGILADSTGKVTIGISLDAANTSSFAYLGILKIESVAIPEPSMVALLITGGLFSLAGVVRRSRRMSLL